MKGSGMFWIVATSMVLLTLSIMASLNFPLSWVFSITILGQAMIVIMVHSVLRGPYTSDKTFDDFYEDHPIGHQH